MRGRWVIAAVVAALFGLPAAAQGSRVELTGTAGPAAEVFPQYTAAPGERNKLHVTLTEDGGVKFSDRGAKRVQVARNVRSFCKRRGKKQVQCKDSFHADVRLGGGADRLTFSPRGEGKPTGNNPL